MIYKSFLAGSLVFGLVVMGLVSCKPPISTTMVQAPVIVIEPIAIPVDSMHACYHGVLNRRTVREFYDLRNGKPLWLDRENKPNALVDSLAMFVNGAAYYGLSFDSDFLPAMDSDFNEAEIQMNFEVKLTDAFLTVSSKLRYGTSWTSDPTADSVKIALLDQAEKSASVRSALEQREPAFMEYRHLKRALGVMLDSLKIGSSYDSLSMVATIQTIHKNLDRWRQEKASFGSRYAYINVPSYELHVVVNDTVVFSSKVIVGAAKTQTPEISSVIECFTIYPYWHVPRKISVEEFLPMIQKNTTFLTRNNFDVLDKKGKVLNPDSLDWAKFNTKNFPVSLRQREGEENALGIIKFLFDNPYAVYVHDTNAKKLFRSTRRAFSHGCIRLERALEFAHFLVNGNQTSKSAVVEKYVKLKQRQTINLKKPLPIFIRYNTAEVRNGQFFLYEDVYNKDGLGNNSQSSLLKATNRVKAKP